MKKKFLGGIKVLLYIVLITLAVLGIAITGVAPTFNIQRDNKKKDPVEYVEQGKEEEEADLDQTIKS